MECSRDTVGEIVERCKEAEELSETRSNSNGEHSVPDEKSNN